MPKLLLVFSFSFFSYVATAQLTQLSCINGRYSNDVFTNVTKTSDIIFGYNSVTDYSNSTSYPQTLKLDFYEPTGDVAVQRPLIILAFGGGFIRGQRSDLDSLCTALAKKGYATATIDYRIIYNSFFNYYVVGSSQSLIIDEIIKASADVKAAIRFFKRDAATSKTYRIDSTKIIIGGASAGAIAALQTAYAEDINEIPSTTQAYNNNGGFEGNTDLPAPNNLLPTYNSRGIAGVINIAGGVLDSSVVDANNPPIYSAQGSADEVVPYNYGQLSFDGNPVPLSLYGSNLITTRANNIGLKNQLYTIPGGNHESPGTQPYLSQIVAQASAFVQSIVCLSALPVTLTSFDITTNNCDAVLRWQTATESFNSAYEVEASKDGIKFSKVGSVSSQNSANGGTYTFNAAGYSQPTFFRIKMVDKDGKFSYSSIKKFTPGCISSLKIYPNPVKTFVKVSGLALGMQVNIFNADGKLLVTKQAANNAEELSLLNSSKGVYLLQVKDRSGHVIQSSKVVKN